jgi:DNA repair protein RadA/Sms
MQILYCAGEESGAQIKQRAKRLNLDHDRLLIYNETNVSSIINQARQQQADLLIVDSIQTLFRPELNSMPGSVRQVRECSALLQQLAKKYGITTLIVGHVTKEGELAGPRLLEHTVDTVLQFEGQDMHTYRLLRSLKNRFGPAHEVGVFDMRSDGLKEISNPSEFFISQRASNQSGSSIICTIEGARPLLVEIQALVSNSNYGTPQRTSNGFDHKRLSMLLAVLEKRAGYQFSGQDVYLNVAGGLKIMDPASDLGVALALVSSLLDKPVQQDQVLLGEIGLGGEIRAVNNLERRLGEAEKLGFREVLLPASNKKEWNKKELTIHRVDELDTLWDLCL